MNYQRHMCTCGKRPVRYKGLCNPCYRAQQIKAKRQKQKEEEIKSTFEIAQQLLDQWEKEMRESVREGGRYVHYPSQTKLVQMIWDELNEEVKRLTVAVLQSRKVHVDGRDILNRIKERIENPSNRTSMEEQLK